MSSAPKLRLHYPLEWPAGWQRTPAISVTGSAFSRERSFAAARDFLALELQRLNRNTLDTATLATDYLLNVHGSLRLGQGQPRDRGAVVYFKLHDNDVALASDRWDRVECNIYAIGKHIECLRALSRYGVGTEQQVFMGYRQLSAATDTTWWAGVLQVSSQASRAEIDAAHRRLAMQHHPDRGGTTDQMARINRARDAAYEWLSESRGVA